MGFDTIEINLVLQTSSRPLHQLDPVAQGGLQTLELVIHPSSQLSLRRLLLEEDCPGLQKVALLSLHVVLDLVLPGLFGILKGPYIDHFGYSRHQKRTFLAISGS